MAYQYIIGFRVRERMGRFKKALPSHEFRTLLSEVGGMLPQGFIAWPLEKGETAENSLRVRAIAEHPIILQQNGTIADPSESITTTYVSIFYEQQLEINSFVLDGTRNE
ncbi:hypothetical protein GPJ61_27550 [Brevibacillus formosus]|uniref:hypothetical protein n=1 Tax=Brevibacillus formosus TaxID=54913 RepID=UPI001CA4B423|nr:hypothetical protein [Brevibacillus formosus]MBW5471546.1 hypothetical protein [Brevibacillus formosus]